MILLFGIVLVNAHRVCPDPLRIYCICIEGAVSPLMVHASYGIGEIHGYLHLGSVDTDRFRDAGITPDVGKRADTVAIAS